MFTLLDEVADMGDSYIRWHIMKSSKQLNARPQKTLQRIASGSSVDICKWPPIWMALCPRKCTSPGRPVNRMGTGRHVHKKEFRQTGRQADSKYEKIKIISRRQADWK